jgi:hypothetical protein
MDWYRNLRIVLRQEKNEYVLSEPYPKDIPAGSSDVDCIALMRSDVMMHST